MKLKNYELNLLELEALAAAPETTIGQVIARVIESEQSIQRKAYRKRPKLGTEDMSEDIRWKMGVCEEGLTFINDLFDMAGKQLIRQRSKQEDRA